MKGGIKSSSTFQISQEGLMERTTLRLSEFKSTQIAGSEEFTFLIDCIQKMNSHQNSNYSYLSLMIELLGKVKQDLKWANNLDKT